MEARPTWIWRVPGALLVVGLAASLASVGQPTSPPGAGIRRAEFGFPFPAASFTNLNAGPAGSVKIDLAETLGKKPVVFFYLLPGNSRAERVLMELQTLVEQIGAQNLALYAVVTTPTGGSGDVQKIRDQVRALRLHVPVLYDEGFRIGKELGVVWVPDISIVDREGKLRLSNGGSLKQTLGYKLTLEDAIRRVAVTGQLGTYYNLPEYYPATEMVGKKSPDFEAPALGDGTTQRWSSLLARDRLNVLVFWSVDCPHCRNSLPKINEWLKTHPEGINLVSAARVLNEVMKTKTEEFCKLSGFVFPTLIDQDFRIAGLYEITKTPTVVIIRPDGVVDSVMSSDGVDYGRAFEAKKRALVKIGRS